MRKLYDQGKQMLSLRGENTGDRVRKLYVSYNRKRWMEKERSGKCVFAGGQRMES